MTFLAGGRKEMTFLTGGRNQPFWVGETKEMTFLAGTRRLGAERCGDQGWRRESPNEPF